MATRESESADLIVDAGIDVSNIIETGAIADRLDEPQRSQFTDLTGFDPITSSTIHGGWEVYASAELEEPSFAGRSEFYEEYIRERPVDCAIVHAFAQLSRRPNATYSSALMRAINDVLREKYLDDEAGVFGLAELATQDPDAAAEEIDRLSDDPRIVGALVGNTGMTPPPGDSKYDVIYRAAEDNGIPIVFRPDATHSFEEEFPVQHKGFNSYFAVHSVAGPWTQMLAMVDMIDKGTVSKFPDLNFVFLEADFGIAPYTMFRINKEYGMRSSRLPLLEDDPEAYMRDSFYYGTHPLGTSPERVGKLMEIVGTDSLLFTSGAPQFDADTLNRFERLAGDHLSGEDRIRVLSGTARDLFGLNI